MYFPEHTPSQTSSITLNICALAPLPALHSRDRLDWVRPKRSLPKNLAISWKNTSNLQFLYYEVIAITLPGCVYTPTHI